MHNYQPRDLVCCLHEARKVWITTKLEKKHNGPYVVKERTSAVNLIIQTDSKGTAMLLHHDKLTKRPPMHENAVLLSNVLVISWQHTLAMKLYIYCFIPEYFHTKAIKLKCEELTPSKFRDILQQQGNQRKDCPKGRAKKCLKIHIWN